MDKITKKKEMMRARRRKQRIKRRIISISLLTILVTTITVSIANSKKDKKTVEISSTNTTENEEIIEVSKPEIDSKITDWELILVNKDNKLPEDYKVEVETVEYTHKIDIRVADALRQMLKDARSEGLHPILASSYRTHETQQTLYKNKVTQYKNMGYAQNIAEEKASFWVAIPGTSEHELGLAVDIVAREYQLLNEEQEKTPVQQWLIENSYKYGFTLRYPTEKKDITKINYEPWHYRYVGVENATFMREKNYCLEEFVEYIKQFDVI